MVDRTPLAEDILGGEINKNSIRYVSSSAFYGQIENTSSEGKLCERDMRGVAQEKHIMNVLYCFSCQGRVGAIEDLTLIQGEELLQEGVILSTKYKTRAKFGYQPPVTLPPDKTSTFLVTYYLQNVRPKALKDPNDSILT